MGLDHVSRLEQTARRGAEELDGATATEILAWADEALGQRVVVASSMQDALVVDLAAQVRPGFDVVFLDTGYHFAETLLLRDAVASTYDVRLINVLPGQTVEEQDAQHGERLHERNPDLCCSLRKVTPLNTILGLYDGWVTGLRRSETETREKAGPVEWDERRQMVKINPIVDWSDDDVASYVEEREVLVNLLRSDGYASIGCAPCTARVAPGQDARAGRWSGTGKNECGIHLG
ncbi:phosphoadenylyl-sulfate reductase [Nocardioides cynanchi]|uniref:phosphoadenylyl-sulfate reductase n=1 Tax=Nocardioides cynanchi TaxID=2558918 RepID=UPI0012441755|nr:phosphoadenylyl-sulfate reductase [Nocardioides cynanchi]